MSVVPDSYHAHQSTQLADPSCASLQPGPPQWDGQWSRQHLDGAASFRHGWDGLNWGTQPSAGAAVWSVLQMFVEKSDLSLSHNFSKSSPGTSLPCADTVQWGGAEEQQAVTANHKAWGADRSDVRRVWPQGRGRISLCSSFSVLPCQSNVMSKTFFFFIWHVRFLKKKPDAL